MKPGLDSVLQRITAMVAVMPADERLGPVVKCVRCRDTGLIEFVSGEFTTVGSDRRPQGVPFTASERQPACRQCECVKRTVEVSAPRSRSFSAAG